MSLIGGKISKQFTSLCKQFGCETDPDQIDTFDKHLHHSLNLYWIRCSEISKKMYKSNTCWSLESQSVCTSTGSHFFVPATKRITSECNYCQKHFLLTMAWTCSTDEIFLIGIRNLETLVNLSQLPTVRQVLQQFRFYFKEAGWQCKSSDSWRTFGGLVSGYSTTDA